MLLGLRGGPEFAAVRWHHEPVKRNGGRMRKATIGRWRESCCSPFGNMQPRRVVIEGAVMRAT